MDAVVGRRAAMLFADAPVHVLLLCVCVLVSVYVWEKEKRREGYVTVYVRGKMCVSVCGADRRREVCR